MNLWIIAAIARDGAIGQAGGLPWPRLGKDMSWFRTLTTREEPMRDAMEMIKEPHGAAWVPVRYINAVIMGSTTWRSLRAALPLRHTIVLTRAIDTLVAYHAVPGVHPDTCLSSLDDALFLAEQLGCRNAFIIGGADVFAQALQLPGLCAMFLTEIDAEYPQADTCFPTASWTASWESMRWWDMGRHGLTDCWMRADAGPWQCEEGVRFRLTIWRRYYRAEDWR